MKIRFTAIVTISLLNTFVVSEFAFAGDKEDQLISKIVDAYGGDALRDLKSYQVKEKYIGISYGQSHSPELNQVSHSAQVLTVDIAGGRAAYDAWATNRGGNFQSSNVSDGEKAHEVDYHTSTYGELDNADPRVFAGGTMRTSDVVLVHELINVADKATLSEDERFSNRPHHVLSMPFPNSPDLKLYVDAETFLVSKMLRVNPQLGNLDYFFSDYKTDNGIRYASNSQFYVAGDPNLISTQREISFNGAYPDSFFAVPEGFAAKGDRVDDSGIIVNKISDRVYHLGQQGGYSLFVDTSDGVVAAGGYPGLKARFERFQKDSKRFKPLRYQVVTHHHSDHIAGVQEAVDLGARLVTVRENIDTIKALPNAKLADRDFQVIQSRATFGNGRDRVEIYEVSTSHAASFLVTYVPTEKLAFIADHMGSPYAAATPVAGLGTVDMLNALDALDIDIKKIVTAHGSRVFTIKDMRASVAGYKPRECRGDRLVCSL